MGGADQSRLVNVQIPDPGQADGSLSRQFNAQFKGPASGFHKRRRSGIIKGFLYIQLKAFCYHFTVSAHTLWTEEAVWFHAGPPPQTGVRAMNQHLQPANINSAIRNARLLCYEAGPEPIFDQPTFQMAMDMAYRLDDLLCGSKMPRFAR
jgi:hypothetical protein